MALPRIIKVFIASPNDLAVERRAFKTVIDELNAGYGRGAHVKFEALGWEEALAQVGRRSQSVINGDVDGCDIFVLVMWRRWGQEAPDAHPYSSYTEEEFYRALARYEKHGSPTIFVFFKHIDSGQMADPGEQLKKVLAFRKQLEQTRKVLYRGFEDEDTFKSEVDRHLVAFAEGECAPIDEGRALPIMPESISVEISKAREEARRALQELQQLKTQMRELLATAEQRRDTAKDVTERAQASEQVAEVRFATRNVELAEQAAKAALEGRIEEARQAFATALDGTREPRVLLLGAEFFDRIGERDEAERLLQRCLAISGPDDENRFTAAAYINLGRIHAAQGDLAGAEALIRRGVGILDKLGSDELAGQAYIDLAYVLAKREDLDEAEIQAQKALAIHQSWKNQAGMAAAFNMLGQILDSRGDLDGAEAHFRQDLAMSEALGNDEEMSKTYNNLGYLLLRREKLDEAEDAIRKAIVINESLGRLAGMGFGYRVLGVILRDKSDLEGAELWARKALAIFEKLGQNERRARVYIDLGRILSNRGDSKEAAKQFAKAGGIRKLDRQNRVPRTDRNSSQIQNARDDDDELK